MDTECKDCGMVIHPNDYFKNYGRCEGCRGNGNEKLTREEKKEIEADYIWESDD